MDIEVYGLPYNCPVGTAYCIILLRIKLEIEEESCF